MANILYIVHKKKFDLSLARYLGKFHNIHLLTSDPMAGLFLAAQGENFTQLYNLKIDNTGSLPGEYSNKKLLESTIHYYTYRDREEKARLEKLCYTYLTHMTAFVEEHKIDLAVTIDHPYPDVSCITEVAIIKNIPVCYLSTGFFRGETMTMSLERLDISSPSIWSERLLNAKKREIISPLPIDDIFLEQHPFKTPFKLLSLWQKLRYQMNPFWLRNHPDKKPARTITAQWLHRAKKRSSRKKKPDMEVLIPDPFILLTLQGNEICGHVENPLGIKDMEHLALLVTDAVGRLNSTLSDSFHLVIKEHPNRPQVISPLFKKRSPKHSYLTNYPLDLLLEKAALVITFNSLTGFEALLKYKPVVAFAPVFYIQPGLGVPVSSLESVTDSLKSALHKGVDKDAVHKLISLLKLHFEIECPGIGRKSISTEGFRTIASKIEGILNYAQKHPAHPGVWTK